MKAIVIAGLAALTVAGCTTHTVVKPGKPHAHPHSHTHYHCHRHVCHKHRHGPRHH